MNIGLVQINESFAEQNYLPYSIGLMQSYAEKYYIGKEPLNFKDLIYKRTNVSDIISKLYDCDVVGFSIYIWNEQISLKIAQELKKINPSCLIIFGGPQVPEESEEFLINHKFIDVAVFNEGEKPFTDILNNIETRNFDNILSTSYIKKDGIYIRNQRITRIKDLDIIPSPYTSGIFNKLMKDNIDEKWLAMWETNRGCPFKCHFCDWGSAFVTKITQFSLERLFSEIDWFAKNKIEFIYSCDANFGILARDLDIVKYVAKVKKETGYPHALSVQNTKNSTEKAYQVQKVLSNAGLNKGVTLSVQSMDKTTLRNVGRANISLQSFTDLQHQFAKDKIETYSDMIIGLPGETYDSFVNGIDEVIHGGQHNRIQFGNLSLLPNTEMAKEEYRKKYGIKHIDSKIINMHGSLEETEETDVQEMQQLVISTDSMPENDWIKTRAYCWMVSLLYFDKILQIPISVFHSLVGIKYREIFESFMMNNDKVKFPIISEIKDYFNNKAMDIQSGGKEHSQSKEWLNTWWPPDEYIFIKLVKENKINQFYCECEILLNSLLLSKYTFPNKLLSECINLNKTLIRVPFDSSSLEFSLSYNVYEYYTNFLYGTSIELNEGCFKYIIDRSNLNNIKTWDDWYKYVVWYGNKKGAYLHKNLELQ